MQFLKANTAVDVLIGPFVDDTDGKTAETGLTISQGDVLLSKNGQSLTQKNDATAAAHDSSGYYNCELDATDTNTEGNLTIIVSESGALPVKHEYNVLAEAAYDSLFTAKDTGYMDVNIKAVSEDTTAADNLESACDNYSVTRGLAGTALPNAAADAAGGLPISDAGGLDLDTQIGTDIDAILADTDELQIDWVNGGRLDNLLDGAASAGDPWTTSLPGAYGAGTAGNIVGNNLDADISGVETKIDAIQAKTDNLPADPADDSDIDAQLSTIDGKLDTIDNFLDTEVAAILEDTGTTIPNQISGLSFATTAQAATIEAKIDTIDGIVDNIIDDTNELQTNQGNWLTATGFATTAGTDAIQADIAALDTVVDGVETKVDTAISDIGSLNNISAADVNTQVDAALNTAIPGSPTAGSINDYIRRVKYVTCNRMEIDETGGDAGNTRLYNDSNVQFETEKTSAFSSDSTTTTRTKLL